MAKKKTKTDREIMTDAIVKAARRRADSASPKELLGQLAEESRFEFGAGRPGGDNLPVAKPKWPDPRRQRPPRQVRDFETGYQYGAPFQEEAMRYGGPEYGYPEGEFVGPSDPQPQDFESGYQYGSKGGAPLSKEVFGLMMEAEGKEARHGPWREGMPGYEYPEEDPFPHADESIMGGGTPGMLREEYYKDPKNQQKLWERIQQGVNYQERARRRLQDEQLELRRQGKGRPSIPYGPDDYIDYGIKSPPRKKRSK